MNNILRKILKKQKLKKLVLYIYITLSILYLEIVFKLSISENLFNGYSHYLIIFSISYGCILLLLDTMVEKRIPRYIIRGMSLFIVSLPYIVEYFVYTQFQVLYDVKTVFSGGSDAVGEFSGDIFRLIFCPQGIVHIFLFMLPCVLYFLLGWKYDKAGRLSIKKKLIVILVGGVSLASALLLIHNDERARLAYDDEYNFSTAVIDYGLYTGIKLDIYYTVNPKDYEFVMVETLNNDSDLYYNDVAYEEESKEEANASTNVEYETTTNVNVGQETTTSENVEQETTIVTPPKKKYGKNILDIDFDKMSEQASGEISKLDAYVASQKGTSKNKYTGMFEGKNLIFITAEAFSAEAIDKKRTPTLYRMATKGINFTDYYQPSSAGTTGGEYANIMGMLPTAGGSSMKMTATHNNYMTIGNLLDLQGYYGKAFHNNSYTFYDRDKTHINLGYSDGFMGVGNGMEELIKKQWPQSDLEMIKGTLPMYIEKEKFNIYYMSVSGHSIYTYDMNAMARKNWDKVKDMDCSEKVKCYLAANIELDSAMKYLIKQLEKAGIADDTVICIAADHFPYGLDDDSSSGRTPYLEELYGQNITNYLYRDHNRLIIWSGCLEKEEPIVVDEPTFSLDILPTLCNLFGIAYDSRLLPGRDVFSNAKPLVFSLGYDWKTDLGTYISSTNTFTPVDDEVNIPDGYVKKIQGIVRNKITYSRGVLEQDYYAHVFGKKKKTKNVK